MTFQKVESYPAAWPQFEYNLAEVAKLVHFDRDVLVVMDEFVALWGKSGISSNQAVRQQRSNATEAMSSALRNAVRGSRLKPSYQAMYNQCVVLYVSHMETLLKGVFKGALLQQLERGKQPSAINKLRLAASDLLDWSGSTSGFVIDRLTAEQGFQSMPDIEKAFQSTFTLNLKLPQRERNNVAFAQACRHAIVHANAIVDEKFQEHLSKIGPRDILGEVKSVGDSIIFSIEALEFTDRSMRQIAKAIVDQVDERLSVGSKP